MDVENDYFLVRFQTSNDFENVLIQRPWIIYGKYLTVQPWTTNFYASQPYPSIVMALIRLPILPGHI